MSYVSLFAVDLLQACSSSRTSVAVSQKSNARDLEALAAVEHTQPLGETVRDLCQPTTPNVAKQQAAKITRLIRLLRGHGLVQKVSKTHRYQLADHGRTAITALLTTRQASTQKLLQLAA